MILLLFTLDDVVPPVTTGGHAGRRSGKVIGYSRGFPTDDDEEALALLVANLPPNWIVRDDG